MVRTDCGESSLGPGVNEQLVVDFDLYLVLVVSKDLYIQKTRKSVSIYPSESSVDCTRLCHHVQFSIPSAGDDCACKPMPIFSPKSCSTYTLIS